MFSRSCPKGYRYEQIITRARSNDQKPLERRSVAMAAGEKMVSHVINEMFFEDVEPVCFGTPPVFSAVVLFSIVQR